MEGAVDLEQQAQQLAAALHSQLSQACEAWPPAAAARELQALAAANRQLAASLNSAAQPSEEAEEAQAACSKREALLDGLLPLLDTSTQELREQLDSCHRLLQIKPCTQDAQSIIRYAHTLRNAFAPLGKAPGLPQVPPAPQLPFMLCSTLRTYNMELAKQQQQVLALEQPGGAEQAAAAAGAPGQPPEQQQQQQPGEQQLADAAAAAAAAQQQAAQQAAPAIQLLLNEDLLDDELGSQVEEDYSDEEYSDD